MLDSLLTLLAAKAKVGALVAGSALATTAAVGGGAVAFQAVSDEEPVEAPVETVVVEEAPVEAVEVVEPAPSPTDVAVEEEPAPAVTFTCDPTKNHGQNVSAYVHSLPKGPGRGELVSAAAQSDCGKEGEESEDADEVESEETEAPKPAKSKGAKAPEVEDDADEADSGDADVAVEAPSNGKGKGGKK